MLLYIKKIGLVFAFREKIFKKMDNKFGLSFAVNFKIGQGAPVLTHVHHVTHPRCFAFLFPRKLPVSNTPLEAALDFGMRETTKLISSCLIGESLSL